MGLWDVVDWVELVDLMDMMGTAVVARVGLDGGSGIVDVCGLLDIVVNSDSVVL